MSEWTWETERIHSSSVWVFHFSTILRAEAFLSRQYLQHSLPLSQKKWFLRPVHKHKYTHSLGCQSEYDCWLCSLQLHWIELSAVTRAHTHRKIHTHTLAWRCGSRGRLGWFLAEGNKLHTALHMPTHKCICTRTHVCTYTRALAAQLGLNGVSSLTYFFTVTVKRTLSTLTLYINSAAVKLLSPCECLGSRGGSNHTLTPLVFPVVRRWQQKEAPFCRVEVLTASSSHLVCLCACGWLETRNRDVSEECVSKRYLWNFSDFQ